MKETIYGYFNIGTLNLVYKSYLEDFLCFVRHIVTLLRVNLSIKDTIDPIEVFLSLFPMNVLKSMKQQS